MAAFPSILLVAFLLPLSSCFAESRKELRDKGVDRDMAIAMGNSFLSNRLDPSRVIQLSWRPRLFLYRGFMTDEECDHLKSLVHGTNKNMRRDDDLDKVARQRRSLSSEIPLDLTDDIVTRIEERISAWSFLPKEMGRRIQIMQFGFEEGKQKYDYYGNASVPTQAKNLVATVILYLSNVTQGGEILFPESELNGKSWSDCGKSDDLLRPMKGDAILFFSLHLDASPDTSSTHTRCPVIEGEMWCAMKLFHIRPLDSEKTSLDSDSDGCTDEDENCPRWAATGECQKNPVYMIGSPDYYGTCRKSCNAC
ncbi:probable prolyl 4-hydroxylase 12 isoform X2 [Eucalyptus grandis]|uniref:probable prolyl 4-hydroxylase 12 isoform X2 n=1 Tax=Eucalyptus grandis TaxID=71139 RepID=UPI00192EA924|nr:probable prolyl 4-hydroxylase 12 isoform X2 [Eucalyptus grandis]